MAWKEDVDSPLIITIGAVSGFLVIVLAIGLQAWFLSEEQGEMSAKSATAINYQLQDLRTTQQNNIQTYRWIDQEKKLAAVPIDDAIKMLVESNGKLRKQP